MPLRCLIVDDSNRFLEVAVSLLEGEGVTVAGVASTIAEALRQAQELLPDVILVDITIGSESGFDLARRLAEKGSGAATVIMISTHEEAEFTDLIEEAPVAGFVPKAELSASAIQRLTGTRDRAVDRLPRGCPAAARRFRFPLALAGRHGQFHDQARALARNASHTERTAGGLDAVLESYQPGAAGRVRSADAIVGD